MNLDKGPNKNRCGKQRLPKHNLITLKPLFQLTLRHWFPTSFFLIKMDGSTYW